MRNLTKRLADVRAEAQKIQDTADEAGRPKTDEEQAEFDTLIADALKLKAARDAQKDSQSVLDDLAADDPAPAPAASRVTVTGQRPSPGDMFVDSDQFQTMMAAYPNGIPSGARPQMAGAVQVGSFRDAVLTDPSLYPTPVKLAPAELEVIDLFSHLNVIENAPKSIEIDRETFTNNAAVFTEGGDTAKAESTITYTPDTVTLAVIAHQVVVTTQALKHNSMLRNRIDVRLINGVRAKAQAEVAATLLASVGYMQQQAFATDLATTIRKAITKAMRGIHAIGGDPVIKVLIAPEDHETLDLELLDAMVALAGQELAPTSRIWRAQVVPVFGLTPGVCFVGDSKQIDFYVAEGGVGVTTGWVDKQFIQNRLTILGEMEAKAAVIGGAALVATDLDAVAAPDLS